MGSLVIESVMLQPRGAQESTVLRVSSGLTLLEGHHPQLEPLLVHVFGAEEPPDLLGASVEFVVDGLAYQWRADFALGQVILSNRSTNRTFTDRDAVRAEIRRVLGSDLRAVVASFSTPRADAVSTPAMPERPAEPPTSDRLAAELATFEGALRNASQTHDAATALYGELFPLLESLEEASRKLQHRIQQLQRHDEAEEAHQDFARLTEVLQKRREAVRAARQLERQVMEQSEQEPLMSPIPDSAIERAESLEGDAAAAREALIAAEAAKKIAEQGLGALRPRRWWTTGFFGFPLLGLAYVLPEIFASVWPAMLPGAVLYADYLWIPGAVLFLAWPLAALQTARRSLQRRQAEQHREQVNMARRELENAERERVQWLSPFGVEDAAGLRAQAEHRRGWHASYCAMREQLAEMRKDTGTDDALADPTHPENARLTELEERCRTLAPYRLSPADRESVERVVHELESEARYQKQAASELQSQCERLSDGWSNLPEMIEQVASLRGRLAEWQRWERAFRRIREVIDRLPEVPELDAPGPEAGAATYLERITVGRWTRLHYDPIETEFKLFDQSANMWIRADRENGAVRSTVDLAYRLSLLEASGHPMTLPLWLVEPFAELPESMATAAAEILTEVSRRRQVVLICRQKPQVRWPEGASLQG